MGVGARCVCCVVGPAPARQVPMAARPPARPLPRGRPTLQPPPLHAAAYEVLSDPEQRKIYDKYGEEGIKEHAGQKASGRGSQGGGNIFDL